MAIRPFCIFLLLFSYITIAKPSEPASKDQTLLNLSASKDYFPMWKSEKVQKEIITQLTMLQHLQEKKDTSMITNLMSNLGLNFSIAGCHQLSLHYYHLALEKEPGNTERYNDLAAEYWNIMNIKEASKWFEKAYAAPNTGDFNLRMYANFLFCRGEYKRALNLYEEALNKSSDNDDLNYTLIMRKICALKAKLKISEKHAVSNEWPYAILCYLEGKINEKDLVSNISLSSDAEEIQSRLCEALYYVGSYRLAQHDIVNGEELLRRCIASNVCSFVEFDMATDYFTNHGK